MNKRGDRAVVWRMLYVVHWLKIITDDEVKELYRRMHG